MSPLGLPSIERHTAALERVAEALNRAGSDTSALPELKAEVAQVSEATRVLAPMDGGVPGQKKG